MISNARARPTSSGRYTEPPAPGISAAPTSICPRSSSHGSQNVCPALDKIESLNPQTVIAGHKQPRKDDDPRIIEETRQYIRDFDKLAESSKTAREQ
jgi:hypothetical protein